MASYLDYLQQLAKGDSADSNTGDQVAQSQPVPTVAGVPVTAASTPAVPVTAAPVAIAAAPVASPPVDPATTAQEQAGIQVTAAKPKPQPAGGFSLPLTAVDQDIAQYTDPDPNASKAPHATPAQLASMQDLQDLPEHKGAFGQTGTLRKILGTLGDAFLVQGGAQKSYAPKVQQEKESDALVGFAQNPSDAIGRLAAVNPDAAIKLQSTLMNQQLAQGRINQVSQKIGNTQATQGMKILGQIANAYQTAGSPEAKQQAQQMYQAARARYNIDAADMPDLDETNAGSIALAGTPSVIQKAQQIAGQADARAETVRSHTVNEGIAQENAGSNAKKAQAALTSASRARAAPNPTNASMAAPIISKLRSGQAISPQEESVLDRMGYGTTSKAKASVFSSPAAATAAPKLPAGATTKGLSPQEVSSGYIMWNGQKLRPKK